MSKKKKYPEGIETLINLSMYLAVATFFILVGIGTNVWLSIGLTLILVYLYSMILAILYGIWRGLK